MKKNINEAEAQINHAITLNSFDVDYHALFANIKLVRKQYEEALSVANRSLKIDSENIMALNIRSAALIKLDREDESFQTIEGALREDPNNAHTHSNYGWGLLEKGQHKKALEHFKEALSNDPNHMFAQAGMLEALKATNPIYRLFLKYVFWMDNMTAKYQWGFIIGIYIGFRILSSIAKKSEILSQEKRVKFFKESKRVLKEDGVLVLCEQMRDLTNFIFFNIGAFHFVSLDNWESAIAESGMKIVKRQKLTVWSTVLYIEK